eukprot:TRINITY_DN33475_c0_g1_i1.p1 TRINITY_DN33475_c0_g1~~TRINITY_DN33475_c0_g1_i1.p1  ORF type:complete len:282 (+),score=80.48 TRINITY_DN33475_c0_g1_i1:54-899(+)
MATAAAPAAPAAAPAAAAPAGAAAKPAAGDPNAQYKTKESCMVGNHSCCPPSVPLGIKHWYRSGAHRSTGGWLCDKHQWTIDTNFKLDGPAPGGAAAGAKAKAATPANPPGFASQALCEQAKKTTCCAPWVALGIKSWHGKSESVYKSGSKFDCGDRAPKWSLDTKYQPPGGASNAAALANAPPPKPVNHKWVGKTVCVVNGQNEQGCCPPDAAKKIKYWHGVGQSNFPKHGGKKYVCNDQLQWAAQGDKSLSHKHHKHKLQVLPNGGNQGPGYMPGLSTH